ncbi:MAG: hypothetical protein E3J78_07700 [Candidatus Cloacimonadota bacterium]|nr:MAG: hypothetical protein E3J78_07700 [Candidatus Cloacimonadota bacterium]
MFGYKSILDLIKAISINILTLFIQFIPRSLCIPIANVFGLCAFALLRGRRRTILRVLRVVKPEANERILKTLACKTLINYANNLADFARLYHMDARELISITENEGLEYLRRALQEYHGGIIFTAHIGNWEVGSNYLAASGFPVVAVAESAGPGDTFYSIYKRYREHFGAMVVSLEDPSIGFKLRKYLKTGHFVGLVGDRDIAGSGVEVCFFGKKAVFPQGPAFLSLATNRPLLAAFYLRRNRAGGKVYYACVEEPIKFIRGKNNRENIKNLTQCIATRIEQVVKKYPDQWFSYPPPWDL